MQERLNPVYKVVNKPLTIMGADRRLFFAATTIGAAIWTGFDTVVGGLVVAGVMIFVARHITDTDPQLLRIVLNADKFRPEYDPQKRREISLAILER